MLEALFIIWIILVFIIWACTVLFAGFTIWEYENPLKDKRAFLVSALDREEIDYKTCKSVCLPFPRITAKNKNNPHTKTSPKTAR